SLRAAPGPAPVGAGVRRCGITDIPSRALPGCSALDAELDPHVGQVLLDLVVLDAAGGLEHVHRLDATERLGRLGQSLAGGVPPALRRDAHQIDRLDDGHAPPPSNLAFYVLPTCHYEWKLLGGTAGVLPRGQGANDDW